MNPAIVAAALNQWGLLNGMQGQGNNDQGGFNNSSNSFLSWMNQQNSGGGTGNNPINNDNQVMNALINHLYSSLYPKCNVLLIKIRSKLSM
ncbi:hypothetical protein ACKWTF_007914 [Chironomus riparius]